MELKLYHYWRSSSSWRVRWALAIKGLACEFVPINLLSDESDSENHKKRSPLGFVPVLEFLDNSSPFRYLSESTAIIEWLEECYPMPSLFTGDSFQRARMRELAQIINADTQPLQSPHVASVYSAIPEAQKSWNQKWIQNGLNAYELLVKETAGHFSVGNSISFPDLFLIPQCYNALRQEVNLAHFPTVEKIYQAAIRDEICFASSPESFNSIK